jgi:D-alanine transaminase
MEGYAYYNGKIGRCDDISVPLTDRLIYFGDGVYDVIIGHSGKMLMLDDHIDRLLQNAAHLNIIHNLAKKEIISLIYNLINISGYKSYLIYISCSRGADERRHSYLDCTSVNLLITIRKFYPQFNGSLNLITMDDSRYDFCNIKTVNLIPSVIAATKAEMQGCDEAIFIKDGIITECAHSNIFILKDNNLITHPESKHILSGITRKYLITIAAELGISTVERGFTQEELFCAEEVIVTSTTKFAKEALTINGVDVGGKNPRLLSTLKNHLYHFYHNI